MDIFASRAKRAQVSQLRKAMLGTLAEFGLDAVTVRLVNHEFNTTFKVSTISGRDYAIRLNINSVHDEPEIRAEVDWVEAIARDTEVWVPRPVRTLAGEPFATLSIPGLEKRVPMVVYEWLPGVLAVKMQDSSTMQTVGEAMRRLHAHGAAHIVKPPANLRKMDDALFGAPQLFRRFAHMEAIYDRVYREANDVLDKLCQFPLHPIHFDVHLYNVMVDDSRVAIFDFDDCVMGWPPLDAAQTIFSLRAEKKQGLEEAFLEGLQLDLKSFGVSQSDLEALIAVRHLLIANDIIESKNPELRDYALPYLEVGVKRLNHYFATGRFDPKVAKMNG